MNKENYFELFVVKRGAIFQLAVQAGFCEVGACARLQKVTHLFHRFIGVRSPFFILKTR